MKSQGKNHKSLKTSLLSFLVIVLILGTVIGVWERRRGSDQVEAARQTSDSAAVQTGTQASLPQTQKAAPAPPQTQTPASGNNSAGAPSPSAAPAPPQTQAKASADTLAVATPASGDDTAAAPSSSIRQVDFNKIIQVDTKLEDWLTVSYGDYNGDGNEEAQVTYNYSGSGSIKRYYVYGYEGQTLTRFLETGDIYQGSIIFDGGRFVVKEPIHLPNDFDCCPTGGVLYTYYKWNGQAFVQDGQEKKPA